MGGGKKSRRTSSWKPINGLRICEFLTELSAWRDPCHLNADVVYSCPYKFKEPKIETANQNTSSTNLIKRITSKAEKTTINYHLDSKSSPHVSHVLPSAFLCATWMTNTLLEIRTGGTRADDTSCKYWNFINHSSYEY